MRRHQLRCSRERFRPRLASPHRRRSRRVLRISGLSMLIVCIGKLFFYDLRNLETLPRIISFIALGIILLGVSWAYTRFRERLRRLL
ncbi:MAG: DUF2339 domain-containing protein [Acidobacteria bacterium]|nr:DUF2339 domain-containing protein [Acidobacteriota bacterium]